MSSGSNHAPLLTDTQAAFAASKYAQRLEQQLQKDSDTIKILWNQIVCLDENLKHKVHITTLTNYTTFLSKRRNEMNDSEFLFSKKNIFRIVRLEMIN